MKRRALPEVAVVRAEMVRVERIGHACRFIAGAYLGEDRGDPFHKEGEILRRHGAGIGGQRLFTEEVDHGPAGHIRELLMLIGRDRLKGDGDEFRPASERAGRVFRDLPEELRRAAGHIPVEGTDGPFHEDLVAEDIELFASAYEADGHHQRMEGIVQARYEGLQIEQHRAGRHDGVMAEMGRGAVGGGAVDEAAEIRAGGHERSVIDGERALRDVGGHMDAEGGVHVVRAVVVEVVLHAVARFLGGLEEELHRAGDLVLMGGEESGRAEEHGRVAVVAASVHDARIFAGEVSAGLFVQRQRVDVGTEQDDPAGRRSAEGGDEAAVIGEGLDIVAEGPELLSDAGSGGFFLEGKLTVPVEMAAHLLNVGGELFRFVFESHGDSFL